MPKIFWTRSFSSSCPADLKDDIMFLSKSSFHFCPSRMFRVSNVVIFDPGTAKEDILLDVLWFVTSSDFRVGLVVESGQLGDLWLHFPGPSTGEDSFCSFLKLLFIEILEEFRNV